MRNDIGKRRWDEWDRMVKASKSAEDDDRSFFDDGAIIQADKKIKSLRSKLQDRDRENKRLRAALDNLG